MSHKGSWNRVKDRNAFATNYDSIFRKKEPAAKPFSPFDVSAGLLQQVAESQYCETIRGLKHESLEDVLTDPESGFSKS
jgi:hypothetical protein